MNLVLQKRNLKPSDDMLRVRTSTSSIAKPPLCKLTFAYHPVGVGRAPGWVKRPQPH